MNVENVYPSIKRIVTSQRGSWKWQDAFRVATYEARQDRKGLVRYYSIGVSRKFSEPQLRRANVPYLAGSIHRYKSLDVAELLIRPGDTFLEGQ